MTESDPRSTAEDSPALWISVAPFAPVPLPHRTIATGDTVADWEALAARVYVTNLAGDGQRTMEGCGAGDGEPVVDRGDESIDFYDAAQLS